MGRTVVGRPGFSTAEVLWTTHRSMKLSRVAAVGAAALGALATHDVLQRKHAIVRNFPVVGHLRFMLERFGPELRQYIVTGNDEERPFSRDQRRWVYASAKLENAYFGFGTDDDIENSDAWPVIKHRTFTGPGAATAQARRRGRADAGGQGARRAARATARVPAGVGRQHLRDELRLAVRQRDRGAQQGRRARRLLAQHRRGRAVAVPPQRRRRRLPDRHVVLRLPRRERRLRPRPGSWTSSPSAPVKAIEVKLSQGAKPGLGGMLPGAKVSKEIAEIRGIPAGQDCASPSRHAVFHDVDSMLDFVELVADATGLPVGIKSAVGNLDFWDHLVAEMGARAGGRGVDFVNVDGGEGGTGAAPLVFSDSVAYPFRLGFTHVYRRFAAAGLTDDVFFIGAGKLGLPETAAVAFALGVDSVNVGREAMFALGCIQAQKCHTDECPTGVATQNAWLQRGLDPHLKSVRVGNYVVSLRRDLLKVSEAVGVVHPGLITPDDIDIAHGIESSRGLREVYGYEPGWGVLGESLQQELVDLMCEQRQVRRTRSALYHRYSPPHRSTGAEACVTVSYKPRGRPSRPAGGPDGLVVVAVALVGEGADEALGPGGDVVLGHLLAHGAHPAGDLLRFGLVRREQGGLHAVDVVGVDQPGLAQLVGGAGELREHQCAVVVGTAGDVLLGDQVHAVAVRRHDHDVGDPVERGHLLARQRRVQVVHGGPADPAVLAVDPPDQALGLVAEDLVLLDLLA